MRRVLGTVIISIVVGMFGLAGCYEWPETEWPGARLPTYIPNNYDPHWPTLQLGGGNVGRDQNPPKSPSEECLTLDECKEVMKAATTVRVFLVKHNIVGTLYNLICFQ